MVDALIETLRERGRGARVIQLFYRGVPLSAVFDLIGGLMTPRSRLWTRMAIITGTDAKAKNHDRLRLRILAAVILVVVITGIMAARGPYRSAPPAKKGPGEPSSTNTLPLPARLLESPPPVLPNILAGLTPDQARISNAVVPFPKGKLPTLSRFVYAGSAQDRAFALTCLAAAVLYEAGDDKIGEQAVAQVVLNRLRHPAFPKTVCGVVFQGSERATGCQFTFTCDGSTDRTPRPDAWRRAKEVADAALSGYVDASVGTATHYHTDWVVPYWRDTLTKLAKVGTQIFYRWPGGWGNPPAFVGKLQPGEQVLKSIKPLLDAEPATPDLAALDKSDKTEPPEIDGLPRPEIAGLDVTRLGAGKVIATNADHSEFIVLLDPSAFSGSYALASLALCKGSQTCRTMGWVSAAKAPHSLKVSPSALKSMSFIYRKNGGDKSDYAQWDCQLFPRHDQTQCIPPHYGEPAAG